jgi:hypothetical protein
LFRGSTAKLRAAASGSAGRGSGAEGASIAASPKSDS